MFRFLIKAWIRKGERGKLRCFEMKEEGDMRTKKEKEKMRGPR